MKLNKLLIRIDYDKKLLIKKLNYYHIKIINLNDHYYLISHSNYLKLIKYLPIIEVVIIFDYSLFGIIKYLKKRITIISLLLLFIINYLVITNLIIKVNINTSDISLKSNIRVSLKNNGIKPFTIKKDYNQINKIKTSLLKEYRDEIEWLEIKRIGMIYQIDIVKRINKQPTTKNDYCNIYANSEGLIRRVIYDQGALMVNQDELVAKNQLLISGKIMKDEEIKQYVCASGKVYAEVWYNIELNFPNYETKNIKTNKSQYNLYINDYNIFNHKYPDYLKATIKKVGKLRLVKEEKIYQKQITLTDSEIVDKANQLINEKLNINLNGDYTILNQKVLKKELINSTINMVVFVSVEKNIANQIIETKE